MSTATDASHHHDVLKIIKLEQHQRKRPAGLSASMNRLSQMANQPGIIIFGFAVSRGDQSCSRFGGVRVGLFSTACR